MNNNNILKAGSKNLNTENWKVFHPSGRHMFTCGEKKAYWYLERKLAKRIGNKKIKFTFDPKGNGFEDNEVFGRSPREPRCVVSGLTDDLQRHHIVPYCYRSFFPVKYKSKNHHDVVLIHHELHSEYEQYASKYKDEISRIYGVKTIEEYNGEYTAKLRETGKKNAILFNTILSLFKCYNKVSQDVIFEKLQYISEHTNLPIETLSTFTYVQFYKMYLYLKEEHRKEIELFKTERRLEYEHGYHVMQKLDSEEKIEEFVKLWRMHFIETMNPQFMPNGWSVDFRIKTKLSSKNNLNEE